MSKKVECDCCGKQRDDDALSRYGDEPWWRLEPGWGSFDYDDYVTRDFCSWECVAIYAGEKAGE